MPQIAQVTIFNPDTGVIGQGKQIVISKRKARGLINKTHVIVPIKPTRQMLENVWDNKTMAGWNMDMVAAVFRDNGVPRSIFDVAYKAMIKDKT